MGTKIAEDEKLSSPTAAFRFSDKLWSLGSVCLHLLNQGFFADIQLEGLAQIGIDDFCKVELRVAQVKECEKVKKSKKLLKLTLLDGEGERTVASGIAQYYTPEEMVGKKVMVLVNLKPATLAGVLSEGMLLCAEDAEGNLALMKPEKDMPAGAEIC